jgi:hypothetical protein
MGCRLRQAQRLIYLSPATNCLDSSTLILVGKIGWEVKTRSALGVGLATHL